MFGLTFLNLLGIIMDYFYFSRVLIGKSRYGEVGQRVSVFFSPSEMEPMRSAMFF